MARMVLGVFTRRDQAENAISKLEDSGFKTKDISVVMKDQAVAEDISHDTGASVAEGAASGATAGGVIGGLAGLLVGLGAITIPGLGAILIGGPIAAALGLTGAAATTVSGAMTGALAGGLVGVLVGLGIPEEDAKVYEERVKSGAILLAVPTTASTEDDAREILETYGADQVKSVGMNTPRARGEEEEYGTPSYYSELRKEKRRKDQEDVDDEDLL